MQRTIVMSGIGGQGVQFAAQALCRAGALEGRHSQYFSFVGGVMRGGLSSAFVVLADEPVEIPPMFDDAWVGLPLHQEYAPLVLDRTGPASLVFAETGDVDCASCDGRVLDMPLRAIAPGKAAAASAFSLIAMGFLSASTRLVACDSLVAGMEQALPPYRRRRSATNATAIQAGFDAAAGVADAWALREAHE